VLVIGAQEGHADGVDRGLEAHELEDRLRPYLGPQFPAFEFGRIGVGADREVLFVIAQPPEDGDWSNRGNDVEVILTPKSFRPNVPWVSDQNDYVLLARNPQHQS